MNADMRNQQTAFEDAFNLLCGTKIGEGRDRTVYECILLPDCVVKVELGYEFQNQAEWEVWMAVKGTPFEKWFAPIEWGSFNGQILIMKRTEPKPMADYPEMVPRFFADMKFRNYGFINGQLVAHDYGRTNLMQFGLTKKMKKANWWIKNPGDYNGENKE